MGKISMPKFIKPKPRTTIGRGNLFEGVYSDDKKLISNDLSLSVKRVKDLIEDGSGKVLVITGAGVSVDSGIRAYRGSKGSYTVNKSFRPIFYHEFLQSVAFRKRYWARSFLGYPTVRAAEPNQSHYALASLMKMGLIHHLITQNVDRLHHKALNFEPKRNSEDPNDKSFWLNHPQITELHGTLKHVRCLNCGHLLDRDDFQDQLSELNPTWKDYSDSRNFLGQEIKTNPDGDVDLGDKSYESFELPRCGKCSSDMLKPAVTFFGESLSAETKRRCDDIMKESSNLLLVGTSLTTYSAYRLVKQMKENSLKKNSVIGMINIGVSRADEILDWKIGSDDDMNDDLNVLGCSQVLRQVELEFSKHK